MKRIIFINRFFFPDQSATSQILSDLLFAIQGQVNAEFHVITSRNTYENNMYLKSFEEMNGIKIHRVWTTRFGRSNLLGRAFDYLSFYVSTLLSLLFLLRKGDIAVAKTDPPVISFIAYMVVRLKRAYLINWIQDLFPEVAGELGVLRKNSTLFYVLKTIKNISIKSASMNVVIGEKMARILADDGVVDEKISVIHNWNINTATEYVPRERNELITKWGLKDKFVIGYSGNFGRAHEYDSIIKMIEAFKEQGDISFLFIGGGKYYNDLKKYVDVKDINNIKFMSYQHKDNLNHSLSVPHVHLISLKPELEGLIVPSKFYGLASIGAPMIFIGSKDGQIGSMLQENHCGVVVSNTNPEALVESIENIRSGVLDISEMSSRVKALYNSRYRPEIAYQKWCNILERYV